MDIKDRSRFYFLLENGENVNNQSKRMKQAFDFVNHQNYHAEWINFDCLKMKNLSPKDISYRIVMENFINSNSPFEYLRNKESRIINPLVINYCYRNVCSQPFTNIPMRSWPIFSQCMRGLEITSSQLSPTKQNQIKNKIEMMSGKYHCHLHATTSFLVTDSILSQKSLSALENNIPIMNIEWIEMCWSKYQYEYRRAGEMNIVSKYRLPIFHKLNIVVSGLSMKEREEIKNLVEIHGGNYRPSLMVKSNQTNTILLLHSSKGEKYKYAKRMNVPCVRVQWIYDSFETGHILPFDQYHIDTESKIDKIDVDNDDALVDSEQSSTSTDNDDENSEEFNSKNEIPNNDDEVDEYECNSNIQDENEKEWEIIEPIPTIMFSGFEKEEKLRLSRLCSEKIPEVIIKNDSIVTGELTHLILAEPHGTEKVYAAIAAAAFILKPNYIKDSIEKQTLLTEKEYQWGNGIHDEKLGTCGPKLMKSAIEWNNYLRKNKQSMFHGYKFLLLFDDTKFDLTLLMSCANILRAGGAKIIHLDELNGDENKELLEQIDYAIVEWRIGKKLTINQRSLFDYIEYFDQNERLISDTIIYRYILEGPDISLNDLITKYPVDINDFS